MGKCQTCNLEVLDETESCPLCRSILEQTEEVENMYPNVRLKMQRFKLATNIYLFCAILAEAALLALDLLTDAQIWWSAITGLGLLYLYLLMRYTILGRSGYRAKVLLLALLSILITVGIDYFSGYRGWSVNYVLPAILMGVEAVLVVCMIWNHRNWQSYIMWQLLMILCSVIPPLLFLAGVEQQPYLTFLPLVVSVAVFLGTLIIGDRRARMELARRFHL